jgi:NAD-dependent SIR2 family protein deacetylase
MFGMNSRYITDTPDGINKLQKALDEAEAVVVGAGAGLSTSAGFIYTGERLQKYFGDFVEKYRIPDMYSGGFMVMQLPPEVNWAYWSRYIYINRYMNPPKPVYNNLLSLVKDKDYFVLTTNVDHCFQKAGFDKHRLFYTQGDYGLWQCSKPCHKKTYDNEEAVKKMVISQGFTIEDDGKLSIPEGTELKMEIPTDLIPHCPVCGEPMTMNLRADNTFVQDEGWDKAAERYSEFLRRHQNMNTLFIDIASGMNTPTIVKFSFWRLVNEWQNATYACLNLGEAFAPEELEEKAICINGDIGEILEKLK